MNDGMHQWARPLSVTIAGHAHPVTGPAEARNILLMDWPGERTDLHKKASMSCLDAMEGADPEVAWMAFMEAAIEAGIYAE